MKYVYNKGADTMKTRIWLASLVGCCLLLTACAQPEEPAGGGAAQPTRTTAAEQDTAYHKITAEQAKAKIDGGGVTVVDVRTAAEYRDKHIPGAVLVPNESIAGEPPSQLPDKDAVLLVYCRTGVRSKQASDKLVGLGYTRVYDFGGIADWPYETVGE